MGKKKINKILQLICQSATTLLASECNEIKKYFERDNQKNFSKYCILSPQPYMQTAPAASMQLFKNKTQQLQQVLKIKNATAKDIPLIRKLTFKIWPQTYTAILSREQMDYMLDMMYSESSLQQQMHKGSQFIFVCDNEEPVGFAAYFQKELSIFKLDKIYVLPSQQGKGTGRFVIDYIINDIKQKGGIALQLQVNRYNNAKTFYEKLGFVVTEEADFHIGNGYFMNDYVMEKKI